MAGNGELRTLNRGERLLIVRRRRKESQQEAATRYGTTRFIYGQWEREGIGPAVRDFSGLLPYERCLLYRRRAGYTQEQIAEELGYCRWWVNQMERGDVSCDELLWYWEQ